MEAIECILSRRSIRQYSNQPIARETIDTLLKAAMAAPSAGNEQPWEFIVITDRKILDEIPKKHPYAQMADQAPLGIFVCGNQQYEKYEGYWVQDLSAATQNILLSAHAIGLGGVWVGIYPRDHRESAFRTLLNLPEHIIPLSLVLLGYPAEQKPPAERYNSQRVHYNQW